MRIIAHFMHEDEEAFARQILDNITATESFIVGEIEESEIPELESKGLIVQVLEDVPPEPLDQLVTTFQNESPALAGLDRIVESEVPTDRYIAQLSGPLMEEWRTDLTSAGATVLEAIGSFRLILKIPDERFITVNALKFIERLVKYSALATEPEKRRSIKSRIDSAGMQMRGYDIGVHQEEDLPALLNWLSARQIPIAGSSRTKVRVFLLDGDDRLNDLQSLHEVSIVQEYVPPVFYNDRARMLIGVDDPTGASQLDQTGAGQIIGIADSGLDDQHPDFQGRINTLVALGRPGDPTDTHGHGTHVAGSAAGDGSASNGEIQGTAPAAEIFFQSVMDATGGLSGLPLDLNDLFQEAYDGGARIHNNSWGADVQAAYTFNSIEVDQFVSDNQDMTVVVAAGNDGTSRNNFNAAKGFVDWLSVGAPATSKNALTVGASRSDRTSGGLAALTFGDVWPNDFPDAPIRDEPTSGDPEQIAGFSSRGPSDDRRIKPDLVAPGTNIASAKSSRAPLRNFWGAFPGHSGRYAYMGGTSMAAPLVAGCAALVREYYATEHNHEASAALVKATLINGTRWLSGFDAIAEFADLPNFHQGFGCVNMPTTLPHQQTPNFGLAFEDGWSDATNAFVQTGQRVRFEFDVDEGLPLRICLTWTDAPGRALQNNLNLFVQERPNGPKHLGNAKLPLRLRLPDTENNVEVVRLDNPSPGTYMIQVSAANLLARGQHFALVVTGENVSPLRPA